MPDFTFDPTRYKPKESEGPLGKPLCKLRLAQDAPALLAHAERVTRQNAIMREALNDIAAWHDGPVVGPHFDSPGNADCARQALRLCGEGEK